MEFRTRSSTCTCTNVVQSLLMNITTHTQKKFFWQRLEKVPIEWYMTTSNDTSTFSSVGGEIFPLDVSSRLRHVWLKKYFFTTYFQLKTIIVRTYDICLPLVFFLLRSIRFVSFCSFFFFSKIRLHTRIEKKGRQRMVVMVQGQKKRTPWSSRCFRRRRKKFKIFLFVIKEMTKKKS